MISAIIPVYNTQPNELLAAIESLRSTQAAQEILLVDDHSDSIETQATLRQLSESGVCRIIMSQHFNSASGARATGVYNAKHDYILSMDADDTIKGHVTRHLAPINLATNNAPKIELNHPLDYISGPQPLQWGSIVRKDIAKHIAYCVGEDDRQEDIGWGYRLFLTAWRDKLPIKYSGIDYKWRSYHGRDTKTARMIQTRKEAEVVFLRRLKGALDDLDFQEREQIWTWANRKNIIKPAVELIQYSPEHRVDIHVLSYSESWSSLKKSLKSLETLPANIYLVIGGFPGSIGKARSFAFTLGSAEYVSFVDDDDIIIPEAFDKCLDALDNNKQAVGVYTDLIHYHHDHDNGNAERKEHPWNPVRQLLYAPEITHLKIMRREHVEPYIDELNNWPTFEEYVLCGLMAERGVWEHLPIIGAKKRYKPASNSSMRLASEELWTKALKKVTPTLMKSRHLHLGVKPKPAVIRGRSPRNRRV